MSIFYEAGCRAALVKLGATPEEAIEAVPPTAPPSARGTLGPLGNIGDYMSSLSLKGIGSQMGHALGGGALGAAAGAGISSLGGHGWAPGAMIGGAAGYGLGTGGKGIANTVRNLQIGRENLRANREQEAGAGEEALAARRAEIERLQGRIRGMGY